MKSACIWTLVLGGTVVGAAAALLVLVAVTFVMRSRTH